MEGRTENALDVLSDNKQKRNIDNINQFVHYTDVVTTPRKVFDVENTTENTATATETNTHVQNPHYITEYSKTGVKVTKSSHHGRKQKVYYFKAVLNESYAQRALCPILGLRGVVKYYFVFACYFIIVCLP